MVEVFFWSELKLLLKFWSELGCSRGDGQLRRENRIKQTGKATYLCSSRDERGARAEVSVVLERKRVVLNPLGLVLDSVYLGNI